MHRGGTKKVIRNHQGREHVPLGPKEQLPRPPMSSLALEQDLQTAPSGGLGEGWRGREMAVVNEYGLLEG